ncbi:MAG: DUF2934 domain-containing protein [Candidatus Methylacidiphilales bacterium]
MKTIQREFTNEDVAVRAYYLWEAAGYPVSSGHEFWYEALNQMEIEHSKKIATVSAILPSEAGVGKKTAVKNRRQPKAKVSSEEKPQPSKKKKKNKKKNSLESDKPKPKKPKVKKDFSKKSSNKSKS